MVERFSGFLDYRSKQRQVLILADQVIHLSLKGCFYIMSKSVSCYKIKKVAEMMTR